MFKTGQKLSTRLLETINSPDKHLFQITKMNPEIIRQDNDNECFGLVSENETGIGQKDMQAR